MQSKLVMAAIAVTALTVGSANASERCNEARDSWMSKDALRAKTEAQGFKVKKIKEEDGCYEVYALNTAGERLELYINPKTGEIVRTKVDD